MNTAARAISLGRLKRRALSLGMVKAFDQAMQFLLPVVLVRCLDSATFGEYRLLWLVVGTVMTFATLNMCGSLYFFLPRSDALRKRLYVHHTVLYLAVAGFICALAVGPWSPLLPPPVRQLEAYGALVPAFIGLWVASVLLDYLPTVDERIRWQAWATLSTSALRIALVAAGAWWSGELRVILWLLLAMVSIKMLLLLAYIARWHGLGGPWLRPAEFSEQFRHSAPFGLSNTLYSLRGQADQWVAASLFALSSFAAFSIAAIVGQVVHIFRHAVFEAFLPSMSRMQAAGDVHGMMQMNSRANVLVGTAMFPLLALAFVFAEELVTLVYTSTYLEAVPVMRLYIVGMVALVVEVGSMVLLLREGRFAFMVSALALPVSVALSWTGAHHIGLTGAAAGSVIAVYLDRVLMLRRVSRLTDIPLRSLQQWTRLLVTLAAAACAAALAWAVVERWFSGARELARIVIGTAIVAAVYLPWLAAGLRRRS
jgi:O-antigen/teichoic acid export membrane protein